ncbi:SDR family NAD(P)-dependent oxidoreductase [Frankia sp. Cas3]|uniref:SDR family NAD(P)-dependent oxidoreductase n=1 Tax=Frankia sp. Cas3 TaxID=3073926 RepID=UPI002AD3B835|nr:SDR family NAD(P)-dependent oxidoreductase [Frankia sp. Cas3]
MEQLSGGVAVVTGAASGIGRAVAAAFAREGMRVVLADIEAAALDDAVTELRGDGHDVLGVVTDVSSAESVSGLRDQAVDHYGTVDVLHNNAGVVAAGLIEDIPLATWRWVVDVDLWSVIYGIRAFVPLMKRQGRGHVINTASTAGLQANPGIGPYNVAKFGVVAITETLRVECEGTGVNASVLCPGAVNTNIVRAERNRPANVPESTGAVAERFAASSTRLLGGQGIAPTAVAAMVVDAVRSERFWIITHPGWIDVARDRAAAMADGSLVRRFAG